MLGLIKLRSARLVTALVFVISCYASGQTTLLSECGHCPGESPGHDHAGGAHAPCVKLSWRPSVAASKLPRDVVAGYFVYRSEKSLDRNPQRLNSTLCRATTYNDADIKPGKTYFYVTRGMSVARVESGSSNEVRVKIRSHD
jgi:hypothetical protein